MRKKLLSLLLTVCMLASMLPAVTFSAAAALKGDIADMDALSALGIDTSVAPDRFDENSLGNPYGRDVIGLSPVYELYTLGLTGAPAYSAQVNGVGTTSTPVNGDVFSEHSTTASASLVSNLYGHEKWGATTASQILTDSVSATIGSGSMTKTGQYAEITATEKVGAPTTYTQNGYLTGAVNATANLGSDFNYAMSAVASGNFDGNQNGLSAQTVMVYTSELSANGGLYLRFGDAKGYGTSSIELLPKTKELGNPALFDADRENVPVENFAENPYQMQNYLQVITGDWNGDGIDEVAVYIPEVGASRIVVYSLQLSSSDITDGVNSVYRNASKWAVAWTYYFNEGDVVSNMISLVSGDVNQDGIDDLAATWGYYYGPEQNAGSRAVVMFGAKGSAALQRSQEFGLNYGGSNIVRAAFAFGDMAGSGENVLILCGQSDADLKAGRLHTRYVALYSWNGTAFTSTINKNFNLFEQKDGAFVNEAMEINRPDTDAFYSLPLCVSNVAVMSQGVGADGGDRLYFDSLIIDYTADGLVISEAWDVTGAMQANVLSPGEYVEYGAVAGDLTGQTGAATLVTMQQTLSSISADKKSYTVTSAVQVPVYEQFYYYKTWLHKLFGQRTYYTALTGYRTVDNPQTIDVNYGKFTMGSAYMVVVDPASNLTKRSAADFSSSICLMNTDNDSSYMSYTGTHYYTYSDPEVLAVIASPPYFADLLGRDDLSGNYAESTTSYSSTTGGGSGSTATATITAGAYVAFEQEFSVFGVVIASMEAEAVVTAGFTWDTERTSTLEQTVTYSAASGEDMVAFYSIPLEIYEYNSYVPDGKGGYDKVITTVNIPHEAAVRLLSLDEYEAIAADYSVLPTIADNVLTHTIGNPSSYPASTNGYRVIAEYTGDPSSVGYSSTEGGASISQEIAMSTETSNAYTQTANIEAKMGAGAGGITVGVIAGREDGRGTVTISTSGSSFSGDMQNMPIEARAYNYSMNWKIFSYEYSNNGKTFPVVSYIVSDISAPPTLPVDFEQVVGETTSDQITLAWSYDKLVAGFQLYRYYEFPDGTGSYELEFVPFTAAVDFEDGRYYFKYTDEGLNPYSNYTYQIQTVSATKPSTSIYSEPMSCRTKTEVGYPEITISGLEGGLLPIFPDENAQATISVADEGDYKGLSYQWQRLSGNNWENISGQTTRALTISNAGAADVTWYRCRVNAIYYDSTAGNEYYISAYSESFTTNYSKRTPTYNPANGFTAEIDPATPDTLSAAIKLYSANARHSTAPSGTVTFNITGTDYSSTQIASLVASKTTENLGGFERYYSAASLELSGLKAGVYKVSVYYSGNRVFKDLASETLIVIVGEGQAYDLNLHKENGGASVTGFTYGDHIFPELTTIAKGAGGTVEQYPVVGDVKYKLNDEDFVPGSMTPSVGSYTLEAYHSGELVSQQGFVVTQRNAQVRVLNQTNVSAAEVDKTPPVITATNLVDALEDIGFTYTVTNSAGSRIALSTSTDPGNYTVTPCAGDATNMDIFKNYNFTFVSGTYTIIGLTYGLSISAQSYTDASGTRAVGIAGISDVSGNAANYTSGTAVMLYATPNAGFEVDAWTATFNNGDKSTQAGGTRFNLTTQAQPVNVVVTFKPVEITLSTSISPAAGGTISCNDPFFSSGAITSTGNDYVFTATPAEGYHFKQWQISSGGTGSYPAGVPGVDGSSTLAVTTGTASMTVYAYFERDAYTLTLEGDIEAHYDYVDNLGATKTAELLSGEAVSGDTLIQISPKTGYQPAEDALYYVGGVAYAPNDEGKITFIITEDTLVSLESVQNSYTIAISAENGAVSAKIDGVFAEETALIAVSGGAKVAFTARAERGYVFDHWVVNEVRHPETSETLTIGAVGADQSVSAVFRTNAQYTAVTAASPTARGTILYTLHDIYGELVGEEKTEMPTSGITVYKGESIKISVQPTAGSMIEQWTGSVISEFISSREYTINNISSDIDITVYLKASSNYRVYYEVGGNAAFGNLTATAEASAFSGGELLGGGSEMVFTAAPSTGKMVSHWTVTNGSTVAAESGALVIDGTAFVEPVYKIDHLMGNITVRAHFTELVEYRAELPAGSSKGEHKIVYVTPTQPTDNGARAVVSANVRQGGTIVMTIEAGAGFATNAQKISEALEAKTNGDAIISVTEDDGVFTATVKNLSRAFALVEDDLYYALYAISVSDKITSSHSEAAEGEVVTLTISPDSGFELSELILSAGVLNEEVSKDTLVYTFEMPTQAVSVEAVFAEILPENNGSGSGGGSGGFGGVVPVVSYTISVQAGVGGSISPESSEAEKGSSITFTITADTGYEISSVFVDGVDVGAVSSYTFENVSKAHTISASFTETEKAIEPRPYKGFSDVSETDWFYESVVFAYENHLMNGVDDDDFAPHEKLTRAMVVTIIYRMSGEQFEGKTSFRDVLEGQWYSDAVAWAASVGIVSGYSSTEFGIEDSITREQLALMLYRFAQYMEYDTDSTNDLAAFSDTEDISAWAVDAIAWAVELELIKGSDGKVSPESEATRAEVATIITRFAKFYE